MVGRRQVCRGSWSSKVSNRTGCEVELMKRSGQREKEYREIAPFDRDKRRGRVEGQRGVFSGRSWRPPSKIPAKAQTRSECWDGELDKVPSLSLCMNTWPVATTAST